MANKEKNLTSGNETKKKRRVTTVPQFNSTKKLMNENKNIRNLVTNK